MRRRDGAFPRWRVWNRAFGRTNDVLTQFWWVPVVTAFVSALVGSLVAARSHPVASVVVDAGVRVVAVREAGPTWPWVFLYSAAAGVGGFLILGGVIFGAQWWSYRHRGHADDVWDTDASFAGNAAIFRLVKRPNTAPVTISDFGIMQVKIRTPNGEMITIEDDDSAHLLNQQYSISATYEVRPPPAGDYEARWYGSRPKTHRGRRHPYYEITRQHPHYAGSGPSS